MRRRVVVWRGASIRWESLNNHLPHHTHIPVLYMHDYFAYEESCGWSSSSSPGNGTHLWVATWIVIYVLCIRGKRANKSKREPRGRERWRGRGRENVRVKQFHHPCGNASVDVACFLPLVPHYHENIVQKIKAIFHILWIYLKLSYANVGCSGAGAMHRLCFDTFIVCASRVRESNVSLLCLRLCNPLLLHWCGWLSESVYVGCHHRS